MKIANILILGIMAFAGGCASSGAASPPRAPRPGETLISVKGLDAGRIRLKRGSQKLVLDLGRDISGCKGRLYDLTVNEEYEGGVSFEVVDETEKAPYTYVILLASAPPNCNIEGRCGAGGEDTTLFWLKLSRDFKLAGKQAFGIDDCWAGRSARIEPEKDLGEGDSDVYYVIRAKDLPWIGDVLQIDYEEEPDSRVGRLIYDRRNPDAGFRAGLVGSPAAPGS